MQINKKWGRFNAFGENGPLSIRATNSSIDGVRLIESGEKIVPYVTRSELNNGLARFVSAKNYELGSDDGGCITVGLDTQTAFYQPYKFVTGQNIQIVTGPNMNKFIALYLSQILRMQMRAKFNWGGNGATLGRMKRLLVVLPVNESGLPDYDYIEQFTRHKIHSLLLKYRSFVEKCISNLGGYIEIPDLNKKEWRPCKIDEIFTILSGKRLENRNKTPGKLPFVGALDNSNGISGFVGETNGSLDSNVLGVNYNGNGVGIGFYHPYKCIFSDDVKRFHLKNSIGDKYVYLFLKVLIEKQRDKFGYLYKFNSKRMASTSILLPVDSNKNIDYKYMRQYSINKMIDKYNQYLTFLNKNLDALSQNASL